MSNNDQKRRESPKISITLQKHQLAYVDAAVASCPPRAMTRSEFIGQCIDYHMARRVVMKTVNARESGAA